MGTSGDTGRGGRSGGTLPVRGEQGQGCISLWQTGQTGMPSDLIQHLRGQPWGSRTSREVTAPWWHRSAHRGDRARGTAGGRAARSPAWLSTGRGGDTGPVGTRPEPGRRGDTSTTSAGGKLTLPFPSLRTTNVVTQTPESIAKTSTCRITTPSSWRTLLPSWKR